MRFIILNLRKILVLLLLFMFTAGMAKSDKKVALIWGNSNYLGWHDLPTSTNDAEVIAKKLCSLGFDTVMLKNGNLEEMFKSLKKFEKRVKKADVAVFFYSGHAFNHNEYYLVPAKSELDINDIVLYDYFPAKNIIDVFVKNSRLSLFFFDACRVGVTRDFIAPNRIYKNETRPWGYSIYFATQEDQKAKAGDDGIMSPFSRALANHLSDTVEFRSVWPLIVDEVERNTRQRPNNINSYTNSFCFNPSQTVISDQVLSAESKSKTITSDKKDRSILITSNAPDAIIDFNGKKFKMGETLFFNEGTTYVYTIEADGYETVKGTLEVTSNTPSKINLSLVSKKQAELQITSNPNAFVYLDGKRIGRSPITLQTTSGKHSIGLSEKGYKDYNSTIEVLPGYNSEQLSLSKRVPWFFELDNDNYSYHTFSYSFSPKYQIGLDYLYRFEESRFSLGARIAVSSSVSEFLTKRQYKLADLHLEPPQIDTYINTINGVTEKYTTTTTHFIKGAQNSNYPEEYSEEIDPYNEETHKDADFMFLLNSGFNMCNGLLAELGLGAAVHKRQHYMPCYYKIQEKITTNDITGEIVGEPEIKESRILHDYWFKAKYKWSPAIRVGIRTNLPTKWDNVYISIGGGYTYLFTNNKYSSWDGTIGVSLTL